MTTSTLAHDHHESTGKASTLRETIYSQIVMSPGLTCGELAARMGMHRSEISKRCPELRQAGRVINGPERTCTVAHTRQMT